MSWVVHTPAGITHLLSLPQAGVEVGDLLDEVCGERVQETSHRKVIALVSRFGTS